jgi:hypothetical protein
MTTLIVLIVVLLLLAAAIAFIIWRGSAVESTRQQTAGPETGSEAERTDRVDALEDLGDDLLQRRVELDSRRGTLAGQTDLFDELEKLDQRFRLGEISEDEFEAEKFRILSGG